MKNVSILVPESAVLAAIDDPRHVFSQVNAFAKASGKLPVFDLKFVGLNKEVKLHDGAFSVHSDLLLNDVEKTDLIFIPAFYGETKKFFETNERFIPWITDQYEKGAEIVSLCVGAFMLAKTGLLDGKKCSTHWRAAQEFKEMFPAVNLQTDKIITEEDGIYTSGGATSYFNLLIYLVEKFTDRETAIQVAKVFAIDMERQTQTHFMIFKGQKSHSDEDVKRAQTFIENNFAEKFTVDEICDECAISRRSLERRFKKATNNTVNEYIQRVKIEAAKKSLENGGKNITEVMFDVGYNDTKSFRGIFKKLTGMTPLDYRNKYSREI